MKRTEKKNQHYIPKFYLRNFSYQNFGKQIGVYNLENKLYIPKAALKNQVTFYVIHLPLFTPRDGRLTVRTPAKGFREIAEKTGGKYFLAGDKAPLSTPASYDLSAVFKAIEEDLKSQYLLGFYTKESANDGRMHRLEIGFPNGVEFQIGGFGYTQKKELFIPPSAAKKP